MMGAHSAFSEQPPSGEESLFPSSSCQSPPAWSLSSSSSRRSVLRVGAALLGVLASVQSPIECAAAESLSSRMKSRSAEALSKPLLPAIVALPAPDIVYPDWMEGTWVASSSFAGFELPVKKLSKETLMKDADIPGFQKLSVLALPDVGSPMKFPVRFVRGEKGTVVEDRAYNIVSTIDNSLGYKVVEKATCSQDRCSITFTQGKTRNAERVELFTLTRESEKTGEDVFVCSEYLRQVTYSLSTTFGVARQVVGEYAHFWTYQRRPDGSIRANLLTAAYLQPQDALFFDAPTDPVVVYSNDFTLSPLKRS
eukprot:CAMPEP_0180158760 /NCGR_PEP_ID=MMETSP0986-20121125/27099_1 /TAXON_ID=697907 /ORGANISM="non described non described, Strain CCMP2293" /LENGTH=309 /DNA_ID=CAMNT_0022108673 /DNA_START=102 /DNA_END=1031 /DNA_ORIENTATION=-